ncbi:MAG: M42 family metallopeptidase [Erysipelotrichaceae bacterium]|nr:M42 family metallopeptidase [Erysipelotrichaceae bacterium]
MNFDQTYLLNFAKQLLETHSPTGYTKHAIALCQKEAEALGYPTYLTNKGNLVITVEGSNDDYAVGLSAHTDTLGLMVRSISGSGKLAITNLGGPIMNTLDGEYCTIITREERKYTGTILSKSPAAHVFKDSNTAQRTVDTMEVRLDEVVKNADDVKALGIQNGDFVCIDPKTQITSSGFVKSRFLDDKISVSIFFGILKYLHDNKIKPLQKTYFLISTYEEVGHGSSWIPKDIKELVAVDMGCIGLDLACSEYDVSICAKDSGGPYDYELTNRFINLAKQANLNYAVDIYPYYGSDIGAAWSAGNDVKGALIGPGVNASHGMERTHYEGIKNTMELVYLYLTHKESM